MKLLAVLCMLSGVSAVWQTGQQRSKDRNKKTEDMTSATPNIDFPQNILDPSLLEANGKGEVMELSADTSFLKVSIHNSVKTDGSVSFRELEREFGVHFPAVEGPGSNCKTKGKQCVALVSLISMIASPNKTEPACPTLQTSSHGACRFMCGASLHTAYHMNMVKEYNAKKDRKYEFDMVVMHDATIPKSALDLIHRLGARTLYLQDSIKELSCHGYRHGHADELTVDQCDGPFNPDNMGKNRVKMFLQQLKLGAATLVQYDNTVQFDIDMLMRDFGLIEVELDYMTNHTDIDLVSKSHMVPVSASHFAMRPSLATTKIWLKSLRRGFNPDPKIGWGEEGELPISLSRNGEETKFKWKFIGDDRDQGLLAYIFEIATQSFGSRYHVDPRRKELKTDMVQPMDDDTMHALKQELTSNHNSGHDDKPWGEDTCTVADRMTCNDVNKRVEFLAEIGVLKNKVKKSGSFLSYCSAIFRENQSACQSLQNKNHC